MNSHLMHWMFAHLILNITNKDGYNQNYLYCLLILNGFERSLIFLIRYLPGAYTTMRMHCSHPTTNNVVFKFGCYLISILCWLNETPTKHLSQKDAITTSRILSSIRNLNIHSLTSINSLAVADVSLLWIWNVIGTYRLKIKINYNFLPNFKQTTLPVLFRYRRKSCHENLAHATT